VILTESPLAGAYLVDLERLTDDRAVAVRFGVVDRVDDAPES